MIRAFSVKTLPGVFAGGLALTLFLARADVPNTSPETTNAAKPAAALGTNTFRPLRPTAVDGRIAYVTAKILEQGHYLRQPFNDSVSSRFLDRFLESLDPQHMHFLESDIARFETYRTNLDHLTITGTGLADVRPAFDIFGTYLKRLEQRVNYADEWLRTGPYTFEGQERIQINRREAPYPKDLTEARKLWLERVRFEYLQEKLGKIDARKKAAERKEKEAKADKAAESGTDIKPKKTESEEIVELLTSRYNRTLRMFRDWDNEDVLQVYLTALAHVYDPHSDYFGHAQLDTFSIGMNLSLFGIGAELMSEDGYCTIRRLLPGGPAAKSKKLHEKDRIVAVAQSNQPPVDVVEMNLSKAVQLIRGPKGTEVRLTILPAGASSSERKQLTLIRDEIKLEDQEAKAKVIDVPAANGTIARLGVIDLPSFYASFDPTQTRGKAEPKSTTADVSRLVNKLKKENVNGLVLDLRRNGGGSLEEAIRLTGLFIKDGPVVQVRDAGPHGAVKQEEDTDGRVLYDGPLVVLTSRFSASASEIVAGALQDYGRALIVGDIATHGKGTVQSVQALEPHMHLAPGLLTNDPGAVKITIRKFYRPSGVSTQLKGVESDIVLPSVLNESKDIGEGAQENALTCDSIASASYEKLNLITPYLTELRQRSKERIAHEKDYDYIREDIDYFKKAQADKTISLNEKERLKEKDELDARQKARDQERRARKETGEKVYELTLRQADLPGLPPPVAKTNGVTAKVTGDRSAGASTNAIAASEPQPDAAAEEDDEEKAPAVDPVLTETEHILVDYLGVLSRRHGLTADR